MITRRVFEDFVPVAQISVASAPRASGSVATSWFDGSNFEQLVAYVQVGSLDGAATLAGKWQSASVSDGTGSADVQATSCITSTFLSTDNHEVGTLVFRCDQRPTSGSFKFFRLILNTTVSTGAFAALCFGAYPKLSPPSAFAASVDKVVY